MNIENNPNWLLQIYNSKNKVVEQSRLMNRTEHEASKTAGSYVENKWSGKDWSITKLVLNTTATKYMERKMDSESNTVIVVNTFGLLPEL